MLRRILALLCITIASYGAATPRPISDVPILMPGGKPFQLTQYRGKVLVVLILLTTCEHCAHSAELLAGLQKEHPNDFQAVAIAVNPEAAKDAAKFRQEHRLNYPLGYMVNEDNIMKLVDFKREEHPNSPIYLFINKQGMVKWQYTADAKGFFEKEDENVRTLVQGLLKQ